jgi:hypothetical protein
MVASSPLCDPILVENECVCDRRNTTVFSNCWRNKLHVSALFWWAIIRLKLEYLRKLTHYNMDYTSRVGERDLILQMLGRCLPIYMWCGICASYNFICRVFCMLSLLNQVYIMTCNMKLSSQTDKTTEYYKKHTHNLDRR